MHKLLLVVLTGASINAQQTAATEPKKDVGDDKRGYTDTPVLPNQPWKVHDAARPRPRKVKPGLPLLAEAPPSDAIVLFNGKDLSQWTASTRDGATQEPRWKVENGYMEVAPRSGRLVTKQKFGNCQLHLEWIIPKGVEGAGQGRGNSGVELMQRYEIQVLESSENLTYADGQAASIYGQWPPLVNVSQPQGEWNVYDIFFEAPKFEGDKVATPGYVTIVHNGVLVHHHQAILGKAVHRRVAQYTPHAAEEPLSLQDHGQVVRYRNIWIRKLRPYDEP
ncbi:MAG: DUF1080 domain-containing protein [Acidobacteriota bacterium]|nr:DUF1080 domain-containing protein [Acidobacteriota bacterium]